MYKIDFTKKAQKDAEAVERNGLKDKVGEIIKTIRRNPYEPSQHFEKLANNLKDKYSRRINRQHRVIYEILPNTEELKDKNGELYGGIVRIGSMWGHCY